jgi:hypothetical protein
LNRSRVDRIDAAIQCPEERAMLILLVVRIDFNAPTVFGNPMRMMLIILYFVNTMKNRGGSGVQASEKHDGR